MTWDRKVPFAENGDMLGYDWDSRLAEWRPVEECSFEGTLRYEGYEHGRSRVTFFFTDDDDHSYPMFLSEMDRLLSSGAFERDGTAFGEWVVRKQGANYSIALATKQTPDFPDVDEGAYPNTPLSNLSVAYAPKHVWAEAVEKLFPPGSVYAFDRPPDTFKVHIDGAANISIAYREDEPDA